MTDPEPPPAQPERPRRVWLRRIGWTFLGLFLVFILFHRPLLRGAIRIVAVKVAAKQNIQLSLTITGTVLTNLSLENIRALPTGSGESPVERIEIEAVRVRYNLLSLFRHGVSEVLDSYELRNADIVVKPVKGTKSQKRDLGRTLSGILQQPALFSDRVHVRNLNLVAHVPDGEFAIKGVHIFLDPVEPGLFQIDRIQIPKFRTWEGMKATASYAKRDLILRGLKLDEELQFDVLQLDASRRAEKINRFFAQGTFFGGTGEMSLFLRGIDKTHSEMKLATRTTGISLERVTRYTGSARPAAGRIGDVSLDMTGDPNVPSSWEIRSIAALEGIGAGATTVDRVSMKLNTHRGAAELALEVDRGSNRVSAQLKGLLPDDVAKFVHTEFDGTLQVAAPSPGELVPELTGGLTAAGTFGLHARKFTVALDVAAAEVAFKNISLGAADAKIEASKILPEPAPKNAREHEDSAAKARRENQEDQKAPAAVTDGLQSRIAVNFKDVRAAKFAVDSGAVSIASDQSRVTLQAFEVQRAENIVTASGHCIVPADKRQIAKMPFAVEFAIAAPRVNAFYAEPDLNAPNARLEASGSVTHDAAGYAGKVSLNATELALREFAADRLALEVTLAGHTATIETLLFALNPTDIVAGSGHVGLRSPFVYDGTLEANLRDLAKFNALVPKLKGGLAGAVALSWTGLGEIEPIRHSGNIGLHVTDARAGDAVQRINAHVVGEYSPELIDVPTLTVTSSQGDISAAISLRDQLLTVRDILIQRETTTLLTGSLSLPLDLRTPKVRESIVPPTGPIAANLETSELVLEKLVPKKPAPFRGVAKATIAASGTIEAPDAKIHLDARGLQATATPKLAPAAVSLDMTLFDNKVALQGRVLQPSISPIEIAGTLPFPVREIIANGKVDEQSPVQLSIRLPQSSVAFLSQVVPIMRYVEGRMSANVDVAGTIAKPELSGAARIDMPAIRFAKQDLPSISNFRGDIQFAGDRFTINRFGGDISGGPFNLTGVVALPKLTEPTLDLHITSAGALLVRNETLTVRADSDIQIAGPLNTANVTGNVGLTRSRFFREIEILPIELPGRPAPKPPAAAPGVSFDKPPLRDWTFNVKIKTKDPFMVRGNLANGQVFVDMALVGNGKAPALDGTVTIQNFVASLPFSKLEVNDSYVYFSPDDPFVPRLDIHGTSTMRDNNITIYIYGTASDPQTVFTSEPPLPQEDIIALLATGTTAAELTSGGDVLAGRALVLATQRLTRVFFKKKPPEEDKESMLSRFDLDVGGVDPKTGQQEVSTSFKVADRFYLIGDLDVQGNVRGQVKYLLRFR